MRILERDESNDFLTFSKISKEHKTIVIGILNINVKFNISWDFVTFINDSLRNLQRLLNH